MNSIFSPSLFGVLTVLTAVLALAFAACAFVFVRRLERRTAVALSEGVGARKIVLDKVRKNEPMSQAEVDYVADRVVETVQRLRELSPLYEMAKEGVDLKSVKWAAEAH